MPFCLEFRRVLDRKSTRLNSSHTIISYAVFCLKKKPMIIVSCALGSFAMHTALLYICLLLCLREATCGVWLMLFFGVGGYLFKKIFFFLVTGTPAIFLLSPTEASFR